MTTRPTLPFWGAPLDLTEVYFDLDLLGSGCTPCTLGVYAFFVVVAFVFSRQDVSV